MAANAVVLAGTVVEAPYFDFLRGGQTEFLRFYLAVPRREGKGQDHVRVVAYGKLARDAYPNLAPGAPVALTGHLQSRPFRQSGRLVLEVVAEQASFPAPGGLQPVNTVFLAGRVAATPRFRFLNGRPLLRVSLAFPRQEVGNDAAEEPRGSRAWVVAYDRLAQETYPYLRVGSEVAVTGRLAVRPLPSRVRPGSVMEVVADGFQFLNNVDRETGDRVREQLRQLERANG